MMGTKLFNTVRANHPRRSVFDLSHSKLFNCDMGQLIPVLCEEVVPGDKFSIGNEIVIRFQPLVAPILHEINCYVHYFFVPYRILWDGWEDFISGGRLGTDSSVLPRRDEGAPIRGKYSLWDYFGFPLFSGGDHPTGADPLQFPWRGYYSIYNNFYRDETQETETALDFYGANDVFYRNWTKDYFTSALPWQQRGTAPALPISGMLNAEWDSAVIGQILFGSESGAVTGHRQAADPNAEIKLINGSTGDYNDNMKAYIAKADMDDNTVDLSGATTFNVADLRLVFQVQKWLERNARGGARYTEFLHAHFGVSPRDDRLQRPEYIGGSKSPVIVSEVLQTSESNTTPQGNMAGHGLSASTSFCGKYFAQEYGLIMGIMSVMPKPMYSQGINRQWLRRSKYDFYFPEFANLSEQAIEQAEIYATTNSTDNTTPFGYQGRFDEMRYKPNMVCADMRDTFAYWHLGRIFGSAPALNHDFLKCVSDKRIFADQSDPGLIVSFGNLIKAIRPLPIVAEPGLIDHN